MALEVKFDFDSLYGILQSEGKVKLGELFLGEESPVTTLSSALAVKDGKFLLETAVTPHANHDRLPFRAIEKSVKNLSDDYHMLLKSRVQVILNKNNYEFVYERKGRFNLVLSMGGKLCQKEKFYEMFNEYGKVLCSCINAHFLKAGRRCPDAVYYLKRNLLSQMPAQRYLVCDETSCSQFERKISIPDPCVEFEDIGGCVEAKKEMLRIFSDIQDPERAKYFGRDPAQKRGYLLLGESGSGKTLLVKALATRLMRELKDKVRVFVVNYQDITSIFRGGEALATGQVFELVKRNENKGLNTLLFLDEIHLIGSRSHSFSGVKDEALDTLLAHLDGIKKYKGLIVIGATYMPVEKLDPALVRDGRLSKWITIEKPSLEARKEIFKIYISKRQKLAESAGNPNLFAELDLDRIASESEGFNGSHICGLVENLVDWKYDITKDLSKFRPITTRDFLRAIRHYAELKGIKT